MKDLASQISTLEDQLMNLRRQKMIEDAAAAQHTPEQKLAIQMHDAMCQWNHTDGCGWHYEIKDGVHSWAGGSSHEGWLMKARKISGFCKSKHVPVETAVELFKFYRENQ